MCLHTTFKMFCSNSLKNAIGNFSIKIYTCTFVCMNLSHAYGSYLRLRERNSWCVHIIEVLKIQWEPLVGKHDMRSNLNTHCWLGDFAEINAYGHLIYYVSEYWNISCQYCLNNKDVLIRLCSVGLIAHPRSKYDPNIVADIPITTRNSQCFYACVYSCVKYHFVESLPFFLLYIQLQLVFLWFKALKHRHPCTYRPRDVKLDKCSQKPACTCPNSSPSPER